VVRSAPPPAAL